MAKKVLQNGKRYAMVSRKTERVTSIIVTPPKTPTSEKTSYEMLPDHVALPITVSGASVVGRSIRDVDALARAYDEEVKDMQPVGEEPVKLASLESPAKAAITSNTSTRSSGVTREKAEETVDEGAVKNDAKDSKS